MLKFVTISTNSSSATNSSYETGSFPCAPRPNVSFPPSSRTVYAFTRVSIFSCVLPRKGVEVCFRRASLPSLLFLSFLRLTSEFAISCSGSGHPAASVRTEAIARRASFCASSRPLRRGFALEMAGSGWENRRRRSTDRKNDPIERKELKGGSVQWSNQALLLERGGKPEPNRRGCERDRDVQRMISKSKETCR